MWQNIGQSMSEYSLLDKIYADNRVLIVNSACLQPLIDHKQAVIFVFAHTGNWEICGNYVIGYGFDVMGLYKPVRNRFASRIADAARARMGGVIKLIASGPASMRLICRHLDNKGALWIAIDEVKKNQVNVPSFGRKPQTQHSNLAYAVRLAQRYNATIIPVWTRREAASRFTVKLGEPLTVAEGDSAFTEAFATLDQQLETWLINNLEQWYMLHEFRL
jgi:KDO2-lipid IV(A) lauroyltransferase